MQEHPKTKKSDQGYTDSGCSRLRTGKKSYLLNFEPYDGQFVSFGGGVGESVTGKDVIKTGNLDFEPVYYVKELKYNLFSVSKMCDKKNNVLFTEDMCFVLSKDFKLSDEN